MAKKYKPIEVYVHKICKLFKSKKVKFALCSLKDMHGVYITTESDDYHAIVLDPYKEFVPTLIHECIHYLYPKYSEKKVLKVEKMIMGSGPKNIIKILKQFSKNIKIYNVEEEDIL